MKKFRFLVTRRAIYDEAYYVEADSENELHEILSGDGPDYKHPVRQEYEDWYDGEWTVEEQEERDPLVVMVANYGEPKE